jgi:hypothetical protein
MSSRIVITGDIFRPLFSDGEWRGASSRNIDWLHEILLPALSSCGFCIEKVSWESLSQNSSLGFKIENIYQSFNIEICDSNWAFLICSNDLVDILENFFSIYLSDTLIIGYEMPSVMIEALERVKIPYIDINLHSIRFLDDLIFGMKTNIPAYIPAMRLNSVDASLIQYSVSAIKSKAIWLKTPEYLRPNTALILGQVSNDRALAKRQGGFHNFYDYDQQILSLCSKHDDVIFKGHPYDISASKAWEYVEGKSEIRVVNDNIYHLLALPQITTVIALNSGGLIEAKLFSKASVNLIPFLYDSDISNLLDSKNSLNVRYPQKSNWIHSSFWKFLLFQDKSACNDIRVCYFNNDHIRRSMNSDWGYGYIQRNVIS